MLHMENYATEYRSVQSRGMHKNIKLQIDKPASKTSVIEDENLDLQWLQKEE